MRMTTQGIRTINLIDDEDDYNLQDMMTEAIAGFEPFDFSDKIEIFILYGERDDFSAYIQDNYGLEDDAFEEKRACHNAFEDRSVIGVEASGLETTTLMTYALGRAIEYSRIRQDAENGATRSQQTGYRYWVEFFAQTKASLNRQPGSLYPDSPLRTFTEMLPYKEEMFEETEVDMTFLQLLNAMSDLMYYPKNDKCEVALTSFAELELQTDDAFAQLVRGLFEMLTDYYDKAGEFYTAPHDYKVFDEIETYKKRMTNYFN